MVNISELQSISGGTNNYSLCRVTSNRNDDFYSSLSTLDKNTNVYFLVLLSLLHSLEGYYSIIITVLQDF